MGFVGERGSFSSFMEWHLMRFQHNLGTHSTWIGESSVTLSPSLLRACTLRICSVTIPEEVAMKRESRRLWPFALRSVIIGLPLHLEAAKTVEMKRGSGMDLVEFDWLVQGGNEEPAP